MSETQSTIIEKLVEAKARIGAVAKRERNTQGTGFNFRGVDTVVNAVSPVFNELGILVVPTLIGESRSEAITYGSKGTAGIRTQVTVRYDFYYGSTSLSCVVGAEAIDSGDKSTAKAMSVAYRTALLQTLTLPTDEPDPDYTSYEIAKERADITALRAALKGIHPEDGEARQRLVTEALQRDVENLASLSAMDTAAVMTHIKTIKEPS